MLRSRPGSREQALVLDAAEVGAFEQLRRKHDLGALACRFTHELADRADVRVVSSEKASCRAATVSLVMRGPVGKCSGSFRPR